MQAEQVAFAGSARPLLRIAIHACTRCTSVTRLDIGGRAVGPPPEIATFVCQSCGAEIDEAVTDGLLLALR